MKNRKTTHEIQNQSSSHKSVQNWLEQAYIQNVMKLKKFQKQDISKINTQTEEKESSKYSQFQQSKQIIIDQCQEQSNPIISNQAISNPIICNTTISNQIISNPISNHVQDQDSIHKLSEQSSDYGDKNKQKPELVNNKQKINSKIYRKKLRFDQLLEENNECILKSDKVKVQDDLNKYIQIEKEIILYLTKVHNKVEELTKQLSSFK